MKTLNVILFGTLLLLLVACGGGDAAGGGAKAKDLSTPEGFMKELKAASAEVDAMATDKLWKEGATPLMMNSHEFQDAVKGMSASDIKKEGDNYILRVNMKPEDSMETTMVITIAKGANGNLEIIEAIETN